MSPLLQHLRKAYRAVDEFARAHHLPTIASLESDYPSWFIRKP